MDPYSVLEYSDDEQDTSTGKCSFDSIDWNQFKISLTECLANVLHNL